MDSKTCSAFPVMGDRPYSAFLRSSKAARVKGFNSGPPAHPDNFILFSNFDGVEYTCQDGYGHLDCGLFLNQAQVRRHIRQSKPCHAADLGYRVIHVEARAGDVMAGAGGAAGPAPDVRHQPPGDAPTPAAK